MALLCFKNGSLARQSICNRCCNASWDQFNASLQCTRVGNHGNLGIYFDEMEIVPWAKGVARENGESQQVEAFADDIEIR